MTGTFSPDGGTFSGNANRLWEQEGRGSGSWQRLRTAIFWSTERDSLKEGHVVCLPYQVKCITEDFLKDMESSEGTYTYEETGVKSLGIRKNNGKIHSNNLDFIVAARGPNVLALRRHRGR